MYGGGMYRIRVLTPSQSLYESGSASPCQAGKVQTICCASSMVKNLPGVILPLSRGLSDSIKSPLRAS